MGQGRPRLLLYSGLGPNAGEGDDERALSPEVPSALRVPHPMPTVELLVQLVVARDKGARGVGARCVQEWGQHAWQSHPRPWTAARSNPGWAPA